MLVSGEMPGVQNGSHAPSDQSSDQREVSWAQRLGNTVESHLNKNILEVILEKDSKGAFSVSDIDCARLLAKLGLDLRPGVHIEGVQVCPNGRGIILITLQESVRAENYCRYDVVEVTDTGIRSIMVKPGGKREVVMTLRGLHPNTRDSLVTNYLAKFGAIPQSKVVYGKFKEGPLKGMLNGDRHYKAEIKPGVNIGSYHLIDGVKVTLRYAGQKQTCGRCHLTADSCLGGGIAKRCEAQGGSKLDFMQYIHNLWQDINYCPEDSYNIDESEIQTADKFTPNKVQQFPTEKFTGVNIKQFPRDADHGHIIEFLCENGLPEDKKECVKINSNGIVHISNLDNYIVDFLINSIHGKIKFGRKIYCNGVVPLNTPEKPDHPIDENVDFLVGTTQLLKATESSSVPGSVNSQSVQITADSDVENLARRHSLSLLNRTPPKGSLAADLLGSGPRINLQKTNKMMEELKSMSYRLSDFGSCVSSSASSDENNSVGKDNNDGFKTVNEKRRHKKSKRKNRQSPAQDGLSKKPNLVLN